MEVLSPTLDKIVEKATTQFLDAEIYFFGSRARKDAKPTSDWDLLILKDGKVDYAAIKKNPEKF